METFQDNRRCHNWKRSNNQMNNAFQFRQSSPYFYPYSQNPLVFCVVLDTSMNITKHKSASQKRRDEQRRELFNSRKSVCVSMPFYDLTDDDLAKCMPKHLHTDRPKLDHSSAEIYSLKEEVELLKSSVTSLQTSLTEERERRLIAEEQVVQSTKQNSQIQEDLQSETSVRISQGSKLRDLNSVTLTLTQQFKAKTLECEELQIKLEGERSSNSLLKQEAVQLSNQIEQLNEQLEHRKRLEAHCTKCGESDCFHPSNCRALFNICKNCSRDGHFTRFCNFRCATCGDVEYHRKGNCNAFAYSLKCQACDIRGHLEGTKACPGKGSYSARRGRRR